MKRYLTIAAAALALVSCEGWLGEDGPMVNRVGDFFVTGETARQATTAAYTPLMWEYQNTYFSEWFIGDIASDDALKGGQSISDMSAAYEFDNFKTVSNNEILLQYYRAQYQGIARANLAIEQVGAMKLDENFTEELRSRYVAEARFLRAFYYFRLVRLFGGVPVVEKPIYSAGDWKQPRASVETVYDLILADLAFAAGNLPKKSEYADEDMGRATSGAAQAMLLKANLYLAGWYENNGNSAKAAEKYADAAAAGARFMTDQAAEYSLCPVYADNFTLQGENGPESVFEIQYMLDGMSDYGEGNGFSRGTFTEVLMRSRSSAFGDYGGWGFNHPTQNLYDEYEAGDPRREATILVPTDAEITNETDEIYLGNRYLSLKRTLMNPDRTYYVLTHDSRGEINNIQIRLADVYLMYAEACLATSDIPTAKIYLEKVRARAREGATGILPAFPYGSYSDTPADLLKAIRHERRVELAMEGHRWFDLCRWGVASEVMTAYMAGESAEAKAQMSSFIKGKHELMPIPQKEVELGGLEQNPNY